MGCDIHAYVEVKVSGKWHLYSQPRIKRNYKLFAKLAGVRSNDHSPTPIVEPNGLPDDMSELVKIEFKYEEGHSEGHLNRQQLEEFVEWANKPENGVSKYPGQFEHEQFGYANGNPIHSIGKYKDSHALEYEDARFLFWFDN